MNLSLSSQVPSGIVGRHGRLKWLFWRFCAVFLDTIHTSFLLSGLLHSLEQYSVIHLATSCFQRCSSLSLICKDRWHLKKFKQTAKIGWTIIIILILIGRKKHLQFSIIPVYHHVIFLRLLEIAIMKQNWLDMHVFLTLRCLWNCWTIFKKLLDWMDSNAWAMSESARTDGYRGKQKQQMTLVESM